MHVVGLISAPKYSEKQVGYTVASVLLNETHEFLRLVINSVRAGHHQPLGDFPVPGLELRGERGRQGVRGRARGGRAARAPQRRRAAHRAQESRAGASPLIPPQQGDPRPRDVFAPARGSAGRKRPRNSVWGVVFADGHRRARQRGVRGVHPQGVRGDYPPGEEQRHPRRLPVLPAAVAVATGEVPARAAVLPHARGPRVPSGGGGRGLRHPAGHRRRAQREQEQRAARGSVRGGFAGGAARPRGGPRIDPSGPSASLGDSSPRASRTSRTSV